MKLRLRQMGSGWVVLALASSLFDIAAAGPASDKPPAQEPNFEMASRRTDS